jgi:hypothetical protein
MKRGTYAASTRTGCDQGYSATARRPRNPQGKRPYWARIDHLKGEHCVPGEIRAILANLRPRDAAELHEYGLDAEAAALAFASPAVLARVFAHEGRPTAIVTFHRLTPKALVASLMATHEWTHTARAVVRWGVREARPALLAQGYERAECRTLEGHSDAIRLLEHLGFTLECRLPRFGATGATFLQYAWRLNDHVPFQIPEGPAAATAAAHTGLAPGGRAAGAPPPRPPRGPSAAQRLCTDGGSLPEHHAAEDVARRVTLSSA